ncbi:TetR/AcrR family transcriptional regulator [Nocardia jiangxiensis]|uniref:TetR/AcrR family transcriptional regulator n=1 Tax=Nocardia jiangxiensis TaxID=282685 RepID=UPI0002DACC72|nr:TetR/AcrR family transcriptional regulator [Nocardia jiangxiensis]
MSGSDTSVDDPGGDRTPPAWADRAAARSRAVRRSRVRSIEQAQAIVAAARRLLQIEGTTLTTQELSKEAGIALQTFYRHFSGKDQLLLAVFEDLIAERAAEVEETARAMPDPVARLHYYVVRSLRSLQGDDGGSGARFITAEHWRLYQLFPSEMARANQPFADLVEQELRAAARAGLLRPTDPAADAWLAMKLVMSVYHHYSFAPAPNDIDDIAEKLWTFCLMAFGGLSNER